MKTCFSLSPDGSVTSYLVAGPFIEDFKAPYTLRDQLRFEKEMRDIIYEEPTGYPVESRLGELSPLGDKWRFYSDNRNPYIDFSKFYFTLKRVRFLAATVLVSDRKQTVRARVWSYAAYDMYLNGERILTEKVPVYKPIGYRDVSLELSKGHNRVFFAVQNFGVRDTRNMLRFQLINTDGISVTLDADDTTLTALSEADSWFSRLALCENKISTPFAPTFPVTVTCDGKDSLWREEREFSVGGSFAVRICADIRGERFVRRFENYRCKKPQIRERKLQDPIKDSALSVLETAKYDSCSSEEIAIEYQNCISNVVLCYFMIHNRLTDKEYDLIKASVGIVKKRCDCADFELTGLLRIYKCLDIPEWLREEIRSAALNFRYWMDEDGADAMCFWSENHALSFFGCQMLSGMLFPDEIFIRSGRTGREQTAVAIRRIGEWLDVVETEGFEEFCAGGYMAVTLMALQTVYDFAGEALSVRAESLMDRICRESARQCFRGIHMSPMGRIYRSALVPYNSSVQALLNIIDEKTAHSSSAFLSCLGYTSYKIKDEARALMHGSFDEVFNSGRAEIYSRKRKDSFLTSVASPRATVAPESPFSDTEYYKTKIMNEGFHGTTLFVPGEHGYQQHLWYAALSDTFYTFVNNPGSERDFCAMRPGYWYGNMQFPFVKERGRELFVRYVISDWNPTKFTHAYYPVWAADEHFERDGFRFARASDGYLALWCSCSLTLYQGDAVEGDLRAYGDDVCWYVKVGSKSEDGSFDSFVKEVLSSDISYDTVCKELELKP